MTTVQIAQRFEDVPVDAARLEALVAYVCERFDLSGATVSIGIVDDAEISVLNERFLNHEGTTDCLSFDLSDDPDSGAPRVFDLVVNGQMAVRQAVQRGHSSEAELALYVTHGLLHQLGFDDANPEQAQAIHRTEDEILQHLGYGIVYNTGPRSR
ncbi:MAG: rRNA maturation RNase YbeY [Sedimentisphaerales bacterium]|nr:rRNA maturation RNase YbeY [Sedimentisphaerales bacterium]